MPILSFSEVIRQAPRLLRKSFAFLITSILTYKSLLLALEPKEGYEFALIIFVTGFVTSAEMMFFSNTIIVWRRKKFFQAVILASIGGFFGSISIGASLGYFYTTQETNQQNHQEFLGKATELEQLKYLRNQAYSKGFLTKAEEVIQPKIDSLEHIVAGMKQQPDFQKKTGHILAERVAMIAGWDEHKAGFYVVLYLAIILEIGCIYVFCIDSADGQYFVEMTDSSTGNQVTRRNINRKRQQQKKNMTDLSTGDFSKPTNVISLFAPQKDLPSLTKPIRNPQSDLRRIQLVISTCIVNTYPDGTPRYSQVAKKLGLTRQSVYRTYRELYISRKEMVNKLVTILKNEPEFLLTDLSTENLSAVLNHLINKNKIDRIRMDKLKSCYAVAKGLIEAEHQQKKGTREV